jgi:hypothetical protein
MLGVIATGGGNFICLLLAQSGHHTSAEFAGITPNTGATVTPPGSATTWCRASAKAALASGAITQSQFVSVMGWIAMWEQTQINNARSTLQATGDLGPG